MDVSKRNIVSTQENNVSDTTANVNRQFVILKNIFHFPSLYIYSNTNTGVS